MKRILKILKLELKEVNDARWVLSGFVSFISSSRWRPFFRNYGAVYIFKTTHASRGYLALTSTFFAQKWMAHGLFNLTFVIRGPWATKMMTSWHLRRRSRPVPWGMTTRWCFRMNYIRRITTTISYGSMGYNEASVFSDAVYEKGNHDANSIYEQVDHRIQSCRQRQCEPGFQKQLTKYREENPTVRQ